MTECSLIQRLHQHRRWVNDKIREMACQLSRQQLQQPFEIGQGSLWRTMTHLYGAEYHWLEALQGNESPLLRGDRPDLLPGNQAGENPLQTVAELNTDWKACEGRWQKYLEKLQPEQLEQPVYKIRVTPTGRQRLGTRAVDILLHVCTHAQYTTAQLNNMLRHSGIPPVPDVMLIGMARQEFALESGERHPE